MTKAFPRNEAYSKIMDEIISVAVDKFLISKCSEHEQIFIFMRKSVFSCFTFTFNSQNSFIHIPKLHECNEAINYTILIKMAKSNFLFKAREKQLDEKWVKSRKMANLKFEKK